MKTLSVQIPDEIMNLLGSKERVQAEAREALVLNLVRRGLISRAKAAELLDINLWDLPQLLAGYEIPWFHYRREDVEADHKVLGGQSE